MFKLSLNMGSSLTPGSYFNMTDLGISAMVGMQSNLQTGSEFPSLQKMVQLGQY